MQGHHQLGHGALSVMRTGTSCEKTPEHANVLHTQTVTDIQRAHIDDVFALQGIVKLPKKRVGVNVGIQDERIRTLLIMRR
jgi:hypothetical protein